MIRHPGIQWYRPLSSSKSHQQSQSSAYHCGTHGICFISPMHTWGESWPLRNAPLGSHLFTTTAGAEAAWSRGVRFYSCRLVLLTITNLYSVQVGLGTPALITAVLHQWRTSVPKPRGPRNTSNLLEMHILDIVSMLALFLHFCHLLLPSQLLIPPFHRPAPFCHASSAFCQQ